MSSRSPAASSPRSTMNRSAAASDADARSASNSARAADRGAPAGPSPPSVRPRDPALRVSLQSPPSVPVPSLTENPSSDPTRRSPVVQESLAAAALRTGSGQTPRVTQAHQSRATLANTAIGSPRPVADSIPRASLSGLPGPAAIESDEVLPAAVPQQASGRRRGAHARTPTPTPPELTRADSESDSGESTSDLAPRAAQLRGREGSGRVNSHLVRTPAAPPSPSVQPTTPGGNMVVTVDNLRLAPSPPDTRAASEEGASRSSVGPASSPDGGPHGHTHLHPMASPLSGAPPSQWHPLSLATLRDRLRSLALQREWVRSSMLRISAFVGYRKHLSDYRVVCCAIPCRAVWYFGDATEPGQPHATQSDAGDGQRSWAARVSSPVPNGFLSRTWTTVRGRNRCTALRCSASEAASPTLF